MYKLYLAAVHILLIGLALLVVKKLPCPNVTNQFHNELKAFHYRIDQNLSDKYVYFIGDSHIQGLAVQETGFPSINYGIGSDTTEGVLARLPLYKSLSNAKAIVLAIGFNDLRRRDDEEVIYNVLKILARLPEKKPILYSLVLPIDESSAIVSIDNKRIDTFNELVLSKLSDLENVHIINAAAKLKNNEGNLYGQFHIGDGIHLNRLGNAIYLDAIKDSLNDINELTVK